MSFVLFLYIVVISSSVLFLVWLNFTIANMEKVLDRIEGIEAQGHRVGRGAARDVVKDAARDVKKNEKGAKGRVYHLKNRVKRK